jgi:hypothetical protein
VRHRIFIPWAVHDCWHSRGRWPLFRADGDRSLRSQAIQRAGLHPPNGVRFTLEVRRQPRTTIAEDSGRRQSLTVSFGAVWIDQVPQEEGELPLVPAVRRECGRISFNGCDDGPFRWRIRFDSKRRSTASFATGFASVASVLLTIL